MYSTVSPWFRPCGKQGFSPGENPKISKSGFAPKGKKIMGAEFLERDF